MSEDSVAYVYVAASPYCLRVTNEATKKGLIRALLALRTSAAAQPKPLPSSTSPLPNHMRGP